MTIFLLVCISLLFGRVPIGSRTRQEIYLHSLTAIRLELLKKDKEANANCEKYPSSAAAQISKPAFYCEFRHPFNKGRQFILACWPDTRP
jgi:hypothetical protein